MVYTVNFSCVVRREDVEVTCQSKVNNPNYTCETAAEQYWERHVLGIHQAPSFTNASTGETSSSVAPFSI